MTSPAKLQNFQQQAAKFDFGKIWQKPSKSVLRWLSSGINNTPFFLKTSR
jgi:hypothetical protein